MKNNKKVFKMPKPVTIMGRSSSITNSFINGIIPVIEPTDEEVQDALTKLHMTPDTIRCVYCGDNYTEWDHLHPLVIDKLPSGYISEINNLVPACGKCNQSKGNQDWEEWMRGDAQLSPKTKGVQDLEGKISLLKEYDKLEKQKIDIESIIGSTKWDEHWENHKNILELMKKAQELSNEIREELKNHTGGLQGQRKGASNKKRPTKTREIAKNKNTLIGEIVKEELIKLLESGKIDAKIVKLLTQKEYSKEKFDVNFPILIPINDISEKNKGRDKKGRNRYYSKPIIIKGKLYLLTSQWYERNRNLLLKWIKENR